MMGSYWQLWVHTSGGKSWCVRAQWLLRDFGILLMRRMNRYNKAKGLRYFLKKVGG